MLLEHPYNGIPPVINTTEAFYTALNELKHAQGPIAADAERASGYRYTHNNYLIQLKRTNTNIYLFDIPALLNNNIDLSHLTTDIPNTTWILHDASQDLPSFTALNIKPPALFDTEFAARFLNLQHVSLSTCTQNLLGIELAKEYATVDWSYRPLPASWRNYAALDVELLIPLKNSMEKLLTQQHKTQWITQEFTHILTQGLQPTPPQKDPWRHVSHITTLGPDRRALAIVRRLWMTRDQIAADLNLSPSLVLQDSTIIKAARLKPHNSRQFSNIPELFERVRVHNDPVQDKMFERYAPLQRTIKPQVWKDAIKSALAEPESHLPMVSAKPYKKGSSVPHSLKYWSTHQPEKYRKLLAGRQAINQIAEKNNIPSDLILQPKILREYFWLDQPEINVDEYLADKGVREWQRSLVTESLKRVIIGK